MNSVSIRSAAIVAAGVVASCAPSPGQIEIVASWAVEPEPFLGPVYLQVDVSEGGAPLKTWPRQAFTDRIMGTFEDVPNGENRICTIQVFDGTFSNSRVLYRGVSEPFRIEPDAVATVPVVLRPADDAVAAGPPVPAIEHVVHRRAPWGEVEGDVSAVEQIVGDAGAVAGGARIVVFDGPDVWTARELGRASSTPDGAFVLSLAPSNQPRPTFVATLDDSDALSDATMAPGLQATRVLRAEAVVRPAPGAPFDVFASTRVRDARVPEADATSTLSEADRAALMLADDVAVDVKAKAHFALVPRIGGIESVRDGAMAGDPNDGRVLLFGGFATAVANSFLLTDGVWQRLDDVNPRPAGRVHHAMTFDTHREEFLVYGGLGDSAPLSDTWVFVDGAWIERPVSATSPGPRHGHVLVHHAELGVTILYGGRVDGDWTNDLWHWDGAAWTAASPEPAPPVLVEPLATFDTERQRLVLLGTDERGAPALWERSVDTWENVTTPETPLPPFGATFSYSPASRTSALIDGSSVEGAAPQALVRVYDGRTWTTFTPPAPMLRPEARSNHVAAFSPVERGIVVVGGVGADGGASSRHSWLLTPTHWRRFLNEVVEPAGGTLLAGTYMDDTASITMTIQPETGDPVTYFRVGRAWGRYPPQPGLPQRGAATFDPTSSSALYYGGELAGATSTITWARVSGSSTWEPVDTGGSEAGRRIGAAMAFDYGTRRSVLFGGTENDDRTWTLDGTFWSRLITNTEPPPRRRQHRMIYDEGNERIFLFGGLSYDGQPLDDVWTLDGRDWQRVEPDTGVGPGPRRLHGLVHDAERERIVVFGGLDASQPRDDVWEWNGRHWNPIDIESPRPERRSGHMFVYDRVGRSAVLFGGVGEGAEYFTDTWEYRHEPELRPAFFVTAAPPFASLDDDTSVEVVIDARMGGTGYAVTPEHSPDAVEGARVLVWNRSSSRWEPVGANAVAADAPEALRVAVSGPARVYVHPVRGMTLRFEPVAGDGSASTQARIEIDHLALTWRMNADVSR